MPMQRIARLSCAATCPHLRLGAVTTQRMSLALVGSLLAATAAAQWSQPSPGTPPSARTDAASGSDVGRRTTVLFGGCPGNAQTHAWDGTTWNQRAIAGPPASWGGAMAYEAQANGLLLFGGNTPAGPRAETWRFTGTQWVRVFPAVSPTARWFHAMAHDPLRGRIVLFGGQSSPLSYLGDTWEW